VTIRILLADDHAIVRDGLRALLQADPGMEVVGSVADGVEAVTSVARLKPDVVVMDINMPGLNGIEATAQISKLRPAPRVLILSMHSSSEHVYRALHAGALGYVLKESAAVEVVEAVRAVAAGRRYLSGDVAEMVREADLTRAGGRGPAEQLSARERQVLKLVVEGRGNKEIAQALSISVRTVETYRSRLMLKLALHDLPALVRFAQEHGLD